MVLFSSFKICIYGGETLESGKTDAEEIEVFEKTMTREMEKGFFSFESWRQHLLKSNSYRISAGIFKVKNGELNALWSQVATNASIICVLN